MNSWIGAPVSQLQAPSPKLKAPSLQVTTYPARGRGAVVWRGTDSKSEDTLTQKILDTNPILESLGNAKTTRNNNSSRFGRYVLVRFSEDFKVIGAQVRVFLLERSRVTAASTVFLGIRASFARESAEAVAERDAEREPKCGRSHGWPTGVESQGGDQPSIKLIIKCPILPMRPPRDHPGRQCQELRREN